MKKLILIVTLGVISLGGAFFVYKKLDLDKNTINDPIPSPQVYDSPVISKSPTPQTSGKVIEVLLPTQANLAIPFTIQAPYQNWELPYGEFCEEASVLMAMSYVNGQSIPSSEFADQKMLEIKAFEEQRFGYYKDTTAEETAIIMREFYKYEKVQVLYDPTILDIKKAVAEKKAVLVPAAGRLLGNPNFRHPGPLYHMLVIKGYTKEGNIITNDPGTRNGANYIYSPDVLMNAIHDWNGGDVLNGRKVIIIVG